MTAPLTDAAKVALVQSFADATISATHLNRWAGAMQRRAARKLLTTLLGRAPTDDEVEQARGG